MSDDSLWSDYANEYDPSDYDEEERAKCKYCGSTNVYWSEVSGYWRLYEVGKYLPDGRYVRHSCSQATADDFEEVVE